MEILVDGNAFSISLFTPLEPLTTRLPLGTSAEWKRLQTTKERLA